ncbi:MAG: hypothetical protein CL450_05895 [Acidimicrobiaceae bacterium]|nr:hypothetical protein [Acidimicrobiaceae bacterium]
MFYHFGLLGCNLHYFFLHVERKKIMFGDTLAAFLFLWFVQRLRRAELEAEREARDACDARAKL